MDDHEMLGVSKYASQEEIRKAYKRKCLLHHPDKNGNVSNFRDLTEAFNRIKQEESLEKMVSRQDPLTSKYCNSPFDGIVEIVRRQQDNKIYVEKYKFHHDNSVTCDLIDII